MKEETHYAKQLFMYGDGDTKPIKNVRLLSKVSGAPLETIRPWMPKWRAECSQLALLSENSPYSLALSSEVLMQHAKEVETLGNAVVKLRKELENLPVETSTYHVVLASYRAALKDWEKSSGVQAHADAAAVGIRERLKATIRAEEKATPPKGARLVVDKGRFDT